jgi:plasmid stability protein
MTLTLQLPPETEQKLKERAAEAGQSAEDLALKLLTEALGVNGVSQGQSFDEILAPVRKGWEESGLSDDQVDQLFDDALKKVRAEK